MVSEGISMPKWAPAGIATVSSEMIPISINLFLNMDSPPKYKSHKMDSFSKEIAFVAFDKILLQVIRSGFKISDQV
jgi:hypothetical protein